MYKNRSIAISPILYTEVRFAETSIPISIAQTISVRYFRGYHCPKSKDIPITTSANAIFPKNKYVVRGCWPEIRINFWYVRTSLIEKIENYWAIFSQNYDIRIRKIQKYKTNLSRTPNSTKGNTKSHMERRIISHYSLNARVTPRHLRKRSRCSIIRSTYY